MNRLILLVGIAVVFTYCGPTGSFDNGQQNNAANNAKPNTSTGTATPSPPANPPTDGSSQSEGERFFNLTVKPAFASCGAAGCHTAGGAGFAGLPLDYQMARALLDGAEAKNSMFYLIMRAKPSHAGGDTCAAGDDATPCKEVQEWWAKENGSSGDDGGGSNTNTDARTSTGTGTSTAVQLTGQAFFTAMVAPKLTTCNGCHSGNGIPLNYAGAKTKLKNSPIATAKNNALINKAALANGVTSHHGGTTKYCADIDTSSQIGRAHV